MSDPGLSPFIQRNLLYDLKNILDGRSWVGLCPKDLETPGSASGATGTSGRAIRGNLDAPSVSPGRGPGVTCARSSSADGNSGIH